MYMNGWIKVGAEAILSVKGGVELCFCLRSSEGPDLIMSQYRARLQVAFELIYVKLY